MAAADLRFRDVRAILNGHGPTMGSDLDYVDRQLNKPDSALAFPLVWAEVPATLAASALAVSPRTTMTTLEVHGPGAMASRALRLAVAAMGAHAEEPIQLRDIAAIARRWGFAKPGHSTRSTVDAAESLAAILRPQPQRLR